MGLNRRILFARVPQGLPVPADFGQDTVEVPSPAAGQFLSRTLWLSLDPFLRNVMKGHALYGVALRPGDPMHGETVAQVVESRRVTARQVAVLQAMEQKRMARELATSFGGRLWLYLGKGLRIASLLALFALALLRFEPRLARRRARVTLAFIVVVLYLVLTAVVMRLPSLDARLIPTAFVALVSTAFFGAHAAALLTLFASFLIVVNTALPAGYAFTALLAGAAGIISIAHLRDRRSFYTVFFSISAAYIIGIAGFGVTEGLAPAAFARDAAFGVANALACTIMVMFLLPIFESLFDLTTNFTLMELSDLNRPLLRRLIMEAPGTYHHSLMVGNLVETVARDVRANGLEARVGAYYHDIGKLSKPEYFFENTGERENKHEKLAPRMSAIILLAHVKEGVELARSEKLPRIIVEAIREHHGRTVMAYFYQKALEYDSNDSVSAVADTARLRRATREPSRAQNARSSGSQWASGAAIVVTASSGIRGTAARHGFFTYAPRRR